MANSLFDALSTHSDQLKTLLILGDGTEISYTDFFSRVAQIANVIVEQGVKPGDRVAMQVSKSHQALALYVACVQTGAVFLPLNTAYTPTEIDYFLQDAEPRLFVCDVADEALWKERCNINILSLDKDGRGSLSDAADVAGDSFETRARADEDLGAILYTSGTTGKSKGAMLTQDNLLSNTRVLIDYWRFESSDCLLHALPIYHTHGLFVACNVMLCAGGSMVFLPSFSVDSVISWLPKSTTMMGVPTFYTRLLADDRFNRKLAAHMRLFTSGSAPMLMETHVDFEAKTGQRILERYGMTETGMNTSNPYDSERRVGTVGFPLPGVELRICDSEGGKATPQGSIGTIEVRGPNVFSGYWRKPEKTAEEMREDGFFVTGDLGFLDEDGYVTIVGRDKDLIISGGFNVYPKEVELAIDELDGVLESAVIGLPHADFGEAVTAVVVCRDGVSLDKATMLAVLGEGLAKFKQPKDILFVPELPRNTMGKVQKNVLRDEYQTLFA